jgi:hypothetical protein
MNPSKLQDFVCSVKNSPIGNERKKILLSVAEYFINELDDDFKHPMHDYIGRVRKGLIVE